MVTKQGEYTNKATGEVIKFDYDVPESVEDLKQLTTQEERDTLALRMFITDARNTTSAKVQAQNGHNQRVLSVAEKEANKQKAKADRAILARIKALSPEQREALGL